ncbi:MAG: TonB-dependent receptor, partial [Pedobacter sp.]
SYSDNNKVFKGANGPLIGLMLWPRTDDAKNYLNPDGRRRRAFPNLAGSAEVDNPYFNVEKNKLYDETNRVFASSQLIITPLKNLTITTRAGFDISATQSQILKHPESNYGFALGGSFDQLSNNTKNFNYNTFVTYKKDNLFSKFGINVLAGAEAKTEDSRNLGAYGEKFLEPNFSSINNTDGLTRRALSTIRQRRVASIYGQFQINYDKIVYLTATGRNDWSSTLPVQYNSFFYPSISTSINFTDIKGLEGLKSVLNYGKIRASIAQVGKDASPYKVLAALQYEPLTGGGYRYGFTGPNPNLKPEMATSYEFGTELSFLKNRINLEVTYYNKKTDEQIVKDIRASYGTGYVLTDLNGGNTQNHGLEVLLTAKPILNDNFSWNVIANFERSRSKLLSLPRDLPESYNSDTWLYGNVRGGAMPGQALTQFTGNFYLKNKDGQLLINPGSGLPVRSTAFIPNGSDRWPDWTLGLTNEFGYKAFRLSFLVDFRKGGDVLNATQHFLTTRGLSLKTLDRESPKLIEGILQDGLENSANPTKNNIVVNPYYV